MKIEIEITPEEFKELFLPGKTQQEFMTKLIQEWQREFLKNGFPDFSKMFSGGA